MMIISTSNTFQGKKRFCMGDECPNRRLCRGEMLSPLSRMSKTIIQNENLPEALSLVLKIMQRNMGVKKAMINLFNRKTGQSFIHESIGLTKVEKARGVYSPGEGVTGKVVRTKETIVIPRICDEPDFLDRTGSHASPEDRQLAFICVPIVRGKNVLGTISIERGCDNPDLMSQDVELLTIIGAMIGQAVEVYLLENEERLFSRIQHPCMGNGNRRTSFRLPVPGNSKPMLAVYSLVDKIAETKTTILLQGESGVGKELVADLIHYTSRQADKPFVKFNCAALPETLIESELLGHEKGAFTGADSARKGRFEEADGGTLFLDEIGEISLSTQSKLLRVLQEKTFERVGRNTSVAVDIRIIAATNKNLEEMVRKGLFREDLYYRLSVFPIIIPPLRERGDDIITLADHFAADYARQLGKEIKRLSASVQDIILSYSWPGNVRELENVIQRAVILSEDNLILSYHLPPALQASVLPNAGLQNRFTSRLDRVEYEMIIEALVLHAGNISASADDLGISRRSLGIKINKYEINAQKFKRKV